MIRNNMLYPVVKHITQFQSIYSPDHIAANPKGYVKKIPGAVEDIERADLQESGHRYRIRADI